MAPPLESLLDRLQARGQASDSLEAQRLHRSVRARLLDETVQETRIDRFVVTRRLGVGGMGVVYAARDSQLDREVAIKLVRNPTGDARGVDQQRLVAEARALAQLSHPNVVAIYDVGLHDDRVFIAMELVQGKTLREWLAEPRTWQAIVDTYLQAAAGLAAAHGVGIVHRDFKPDNALVDADTSRVRVVDFGLALGLDAEPPMETPGSGPPASDSSMALTATGKIVGTPAYMAPEQLLGARADARSDQFSFCVALWEALFGERPFTVDRKSLQDGASAWTPRTPRQPDRAPAWLRTVLARGLAYDAARRWPSMDALAAACRRPPRPWRRWIGALGVVAIAALGVLGVRAWQTARTQAACDDEAAVIASEWNADATASISSSFGAIDVGHAETTAKKVGERLEAFATELAAIDRRACTAHRVERSIGDDAFARRRACVEQQRVRLSTVRELFAAPDLQLVNGAVLIAFTLPPSARCEDDTRLAAGAASSASTADGHAAVRRRLARARQLALAERHEDALADATIAADAARQVGDRVLEAEGMIAIADAHVAGGSYHDAAEHYERAYFITAPLGADEIALTAAIELVVVVGSRLERHDDGLGWIRHAEALLERVGEKDGGYAAELAEHTAAVLRQRGDAAGAKSAYERSIELRSAYAGREHPAVALTMVELASLLNEMTEIPRALTLLDDAERIMIAAHGENALPLAAVSNTRCTIEARRGRYADALPHCRRTLAIREDRLDPEHPEVASALVNLSLTLLSTGDLAGARTTLARAIEIRRKRLGPMHPALATALNNLGINDSHAQDFDAARLHLGEALRIRRATLPPEHPLTATTLISLAEVELFTSHFVEAEALAQEAASTMTATDDATQAIRGRALTCVGFARGARGDKAGAIEALDAALLTPHATLGDPAPRCELRFRLAEALQSSDPARAKAMAIEARPHCVEGGQRTAEILAAVDAITRAD